MSAATTFRLTFLSNVVAYACRHSRAEDRQMATPGQRQQYGVLPARHPPLPVLAAHRRRGCWQTMAETMPEIVDDMRTALDGARRRRERLRHAGDRVARTLSVGQQNHRRKCRKCRKPPILRKQRPFRPCRETAEIGGNWRKPPADTLVGNPSALLLSHPRGALQLSMPTSLAQIAETPRSGRQRHRACSAAIVPP